MVRDYEVMVACINVFGVLDVEGLVADPGTSFVDLELGDVDEGWESHGLSSFCWYFW